MQSTIRTTDQKYITLELLKKVLQTDRYEDWQTIFTKECLEKLQNRRLLDLIHNSMFDVEWDISYVHENTGVPKIFLRIEAKNGDEYTGMWANLIPIFELIPLDNKMTIDEIDLFENVDDFQMDELDGGFEEEYGD